METDKTKETETAISKHRSLIILVLGVIIGFALTFGYVHTSQAFKCYNNGENYFLGLGCLDKEKLPLCKTELGEVAIDNAQYKFMLNFTGGHNDI